jgi:CrcB protein
VGGALGSLARYGVGVLWPVEAGRFPWPTLAINLSGSLLLGIVVYVVFERRPTNRLVRPFLAIGVLGGFTTFSTFAVELVRLTPQRPIVAGAYLAASVVGGTAAVFAGGAAARRAYARPLDRRGRSEEDGT